MLRYKIHVKDYFATMFLRFQLTTKRFYSTECRSLPTKLSFYGSDLFSVISLQKILEFKQGIIKDNIKSDINIEEIQVITPPDALSGRGKKVLKPTLLKQVSERLGIKVEHPPPKKILEWRPSLEPHFNHFAVVVSFGYFLPKSLIQCYQGAINLHPSLLPKYRGAAPILHTLYNGDEVGGLTIQELSTEKFDAGNILKQEKMNIPKNIYYKDLETQMAEKGANLLCDTIKNWNSLQNRKLTQDETLVSKAPKLEREHSKVNWNEDEVDIIFRKERALGWRYPLHAMFQNQSIQLFLNKEQPYIERNIESEVGTVHLFEDNLLYISCLPKHFIIVDKVKMANKKMVTVKEFINGYNIKNKIKFE